jgi:hypothetical protein
VQRARRRSVPCNSYCAEDSISLRVLALISRLTQFALVLHGPSRVSQIASDCPQPAHIATRRAHSQCLQSGRILSWPPTSHTVNEMFLYSTVSTLNPAQVSLAYVHARQLGVSCACAACRRLSAFALQGGSVAAKATHPSTRQRHLLRRACSARTSQSEHHLQMARLRSLIRWCAAAEQWRASARRAGR